MQRRLSARRRAHTSQSRARIHAPSASRSAGPARPRPPASRSGTPRALLFTRWILPAAIILAGAIAASFGTIDAVYGGCTLIAAGVSVWLISWAYRYGVSSDDERAAEDTARRYFDRFGRWPDEQ